MPVAMAIGTVAALGYSIYSGERAASQQKEAQKQSMQIAQQQAEAAQKSQGRQAPKQAPSLYMRDAAKQARMGGPSSTMLTGPQGVDLSQLTLDRKTLLGRNTLLG